MFRELHVNLTDPLGGTVPESIIGWSWPYNLTSRLAEQEKACAARAGHKASSGLRRILDRYV